MNKINKVLSEIISDEKEIDKFLSQKTMDEMYEYFLSKDNTISKMEFDEYVSNSLESCCDINNEVCNVSGGDGTGKNFVSKVISTALASLTILPGFNPAAGAADLSDKSNTQSQNSIVRKFHEFGDSVESLVKGGWKKTSEFCAEHPKIMIGLSAALLSGAVGAGILIKKSNSTKNNESDKQKNSNIKSSNVIKHKPGKGNYVNIEEKSKKKAEAEAARKRAEAEAARVKSEAEAARKAEAEAARRRAEAEAERKAARKAAKKAAKKAEAAKKKAEAALVANTSPTQTIVGNENTEPVGRASSEVADIKKDSDGKKGWFSSLWGKETGVGNENTEPVGKESSEVADMKKGSDKGWFGNLWGKATGLFRQSEDSKDN